MILGKKISLGKNVLPGVKPLCYSYMTFFTSNVTVSQYFAENVERLGENGKP
jgi:hypothetical protein